MKDKKNSGSIREFTPVAVVLGILIAVVFGAANAYLGLRVGLTISASIPAAVISMGIIRMILKRDSILENNLVQTIGSAGESLAAGVIFTLPAAFLWQTEWGNFSYISYMNIVLLSLVGGILGVVFMIPLRKALIVNEDGVLPYPEGQACAEVLKSGEKGGASASSVFKGLGISAIYKFIANGMKLFPESVSYELSFQHLGGTAVGFDALPALLGVGYIVGPRISAIMLAGAILSWLVLMPLLHQFGGAEIQALASGDLWANYIRYIGAGAVAAGGIISLIKSLPMIFSAFKDSMKAIGNKGEDGEEDSTGSDIPGMVSLILIIVAVVLIFLMPNTPVNLLGAVLILVFGFFFVTVSSRMVGIIGSSNNPVSGMSIATLLVATLILKSSGMVGEKGMIAAISIGTIICIAAAIAGDASQDLKTGYIVGATPKYQQIGELIGVLASAIVIGLILNLFDSSYGFGSAELPAPQATLMKMIVEGVMEGSLPWDLVIAGAFVAVLVELLGIPSLPFAIGLYLPMNTSSGIMFGGLVRLIVDKLKIPNDEKEAAKTGGTLYSAGLIAGEGVMGIILAAFTAIGGGKIAKAIDMSGSGLRQEFSIVFYLLLAASIFRMAQKAVNRYRKERDK